MLFTGLSDMADRAHLLLPGGYGAKYLLYPLQTLVCAAVLLYFRRDYRLRAPLRAWFAILAGVVVFLLWVSPQAFFHQAPRLVGFDPQVFAARPELYWSGVVLRFLRLVVVVPPLEEIFWRGFLMRYLIDEEFDAVPFGTYTLMANALVAIGFMLEHSFPDWPAGLAAGLLYNAVAFRTRSLTSCILAHALTNALLGVYIMKTQQWGFW
jgi:CAAX prenyl protease-like protein